MKTLVILAHPDIESSVINKKWKTELEKHPDKITINELYKEYPDWNIDVEREHNLLLEHDNIVIEFPLYWYSYTPLLKKWFDEIFSYNWAYGENYNLKGKNIGAAVSVGGPEEEYSKNGSVKFSINEVLTPLEASIKYVKANFIPPYIQFGAEPDLSDEKLSESAKNYVQYILNIK